MKKQMHPSDFRTCGPVSENEASYGRRLRHGLLLLLLLLSSCMQHAPREEAGSGTLEVVVEEGLEEAFRIQSELFSRYYPEAAITVRTLPSSQIPEALAAGSARAAIISAAPSAREDSLLALSGEGFRREPVARDALVCVVNRSSALEKIDLARLGELFLEESRQEGNPLVPLLLNDHHRSASALAGLLHRESGVPGAWGTETPASMLERIALDPTAIGLLFLSTYERAVQEGSEVSRLRLLAVAAEPGTRAELPSRRAVFSGAYPLATTVLYLYRAGEALPTGFGAWLAREGQKSFEGGLLVPWRQPVRTIILKEKP